MMAELLLQRLLGCMMRPRALLDALCYGSYAPVGETSDACSPRRFLYSRRLEFGAEDGITNLNGTMQS